MRFCSRGVEHDLQFRSGIRNGDDRIQLLLCHGPVGERQYTALKDTARQQAEPLGATEIGKELCASPDRYWMNIEAILVRQAELHEGLNEPHAAVGRDFAAWLGLKAGNLYCHVSAGDPGLWPARRFQASREHYFGSVIHAAATGSVEVGQVSAIDS